ncbi:DUF6132 family protein [Terrimonas alba]|uniref:DUF6132 family protein n=1 Tax=Terrimonas alba TaxID=3349636 RepID=UPI0035F2353A
MISKLFKRAWLPLTGAITGAAAGFFYWKFIGCTSGACAITSKPLNSSIYFAVIGALLFSMFQRKTNSAS